MTVGKGRNWPPYDVEKDGRYSGIDIDIIELILGKANFCINYKKMPSTARGLLELKKGTIDLIYAISQTSERMKFGVYSLPYREENISIFWKHQNHDELINVDLETLLATDLLGAVGRGGYYGTKFDLLLGSTNLKTKIIEVNSVDHRMKLLQENIVDYVVEDELTGRMYLADNNIQDIRQHTLYINKNRVSFLFSKKTISNDVVKKINQLIINNRIEIDKIIQLYTPHK
tara:strand:- start:292 stop:981 length:690 start_codon:yes stop_codon:yes gene_type:complete